MDDNIKLALEIWPVRTGQISSAIDLRTGDLGSHGTVGEFACGLGVGDRTA
jgi:hypothetical protein